MPTHQTCCLVNFAGGDAAQVVLSEREPRATEGSLCVCRFCFYKEGEKVHQDEQLNELVSPCACSGYVHICCLLQHFKDHGDWHNFKCPSCGQFYEGKGLHSLAHLFVDQMTKQHGEESLQVARSLCFLAQGLSQMGKMKESRELLELSLAIKERQLGKDHIAIATTLTELANACGLLGDEKCQEKFLQRSLAIKARHYDASQRSKKVACDRLAVDFSELGDAVQAREMLKRSFVIRV